MTQEQLKQWVKEKITKHPEHKPEILDLYMLCIEEIEQGGSPDNEIYLCTDSINQLIEQ